MHKRKSLRLALLVASGALLAIPSSLTAYVGRFPACGSVTDVDPIAYERTDPATPARVGEIVASIEGRAGSASGNGLVGRAIDRKSPVQGERGTRLEIRM